MIELSTNQNTNKRYIVRKKLGQNVVLNDFVTGVPRPKLFGIAELTRLQLPKCNNHLVSFINVDGLSVSYIVHIFDTIKSAKWLPWF